MAKKTTTNGQYRNDNGIMDALRDVHFTLPTPTAKEVAEKRHEIETMEAAQWKLTQKIDDPHANVGKGDAVRLKELDKKLDAARIELTGMESRYFAQGIKPVNKEQNPQMQEMTKLQNHINRLEMENEIIYQDIMLRGVQNDKQAYAQTEANEEVMREMKQQYGALKADYYSQKETLPQREGKVTIQPQQDSTYKVTAVVGGKAYNSTMTEQQHNKMMALNDTQKLNYLTTLIPSADIKGQSTSARETMLSSLKDSLYNLPKPEVYASAPQQQQQTTQQPAQGPLLASANFEEASMSETRGQAQSMGMGR